MIGKIPQRNLSPIYGIGVDVRVIGGSPLQFLPLPLASRHSRADALLSGIKNRDFPVSIAGQGRG